MLRKAEPMNASRNRAPTGTSHGHQRRLRDGSAAPSSAPAGGGPGGTVASSVSTLLILVVVGLSIVAVTVAVVAEPDKPAMEPLRNLRARWASRPAVEMVAAVVAPSSR